MGDRRRVVGEPVDHQRVADALHQVGIVVRGRAVDAEADRAAGRLQFLGAALARGEHHVRRRAMADADLVAAEAAHLVVVEMDAVGEPDAIVQPAAFLEIVDRPAAEMLEAVFVLVARLAEMGVQPAVEALGQADRIDHQPLGHGERRAGRQRHLQHRALRRRRGSGRARARSRRGSCPRPGRPCRAAGRRPSPRGSSSRASASCGCRARAASSAWMSIASSRPAG